MIIKCKMCGGDIEISQDMTVGTCRYCGSTMTLPRIESEKKARLFNRANEYRLNNEFDKAYEAYRSIVDEDEQEAEAYWGMILSEYGVEYVEDPKTGKRIPTCHRASVQSIRTSANYKLACQYADAESKMLYQDEAEALDKILKKIVAISDKEQPYDVFICYKETDDSSGERTEASVLAQDIYDELNKKGFRVFFSRITLKDMLGQDYEPLIYAALKSAKVMLLVTTDPDQAYSVWVKNEWMRFLRFMSDDTTGKCIVPVYKNMSPYELPDEVSAFQAQDMSKVGAIQDLIMGVSSIIGDSTDTKKQAMSQSDVLRIVEEQQKEKKLKKRKRIFKIMTWLLAICAIVGMVVLFIKVIIPNASQAYSEWSYKKYWDSKTIVVESGYPDSEKYYVFSVDVSDENLVDEYFEKDSISRGYVSACGYDEGWIYFSGNVSAGFIGGNLPNYDCGTLIYKSVNAVNNWKLQNGQIIVNFTDGTSIKTNNTESAYKYYKYVLSRYADTKFEDSNGKLISYQDYIDNLIDKCISNSNYGEALKWAEDSVDNDINDYIMNSMFDLKQGDQITWGNYKNEPLKWTILDTHNDRLLLICDTYIKKMTFANNKTEADWEHSRIRDFLNNEFVDLSFSEFEEMYLGSCDLKSIGADGNLMTNDRVYLFSLSEYESYVSIIKDYANEYNNKSAWWLRDVKILNSGFTGRICTINFNDNIGWASYTDNLGVRPVICIERP